MRFLCTPELGRLTRWLRAIGHDAASVEGKVEIPELLAQATSEERTILTRLKRLRHHQGTPVIFVSTEKIQAQIKEVRHLAGIKPARAHLFERCILCNVPVAPVAKERVRRKVPPYVFKTQTAFSTCPSCHRIYWAATHYDRAKTFAGLT